MRWLMVILKILLKLSLAVQLRLSRIYLVRNRIILMWVLCLSFEIVFFMFRSFFLYWTGQEETTEGKWFFDRLDRKYFGINFSFGWKTATTAATFHSYAQSQVYFYVAKFGKTFYKTIRWSYRRFKLSIHYIDTKQNIRTKINIVNLPYFIFICIWVHFVVQNNNKKKYIKT